MAAAKLLEVSMLKKVLLIVCGLLFAVSSLSYAGTNVKEEYKDILSKFIPPTINYKVKKLNKSVVNGFTQLEVTIVDKRSGTLMHRYLWISKDKKFVIPELVIYQNGRLERYLPPKPTEHVPVDIGWFMKMWKKLPAEMKKSYGKGKDVYMFSDPYCPFCKREIKKLFEMAKENKIRLHIVPFDVHGKKAEEASLIFVMIEKEKGLKAAIESVEAASFGDVDKIVKKYKDKLKELEKKYSPTLRMISTTAMMSGIRGTPAVIIPTKGTKGYLIVGLSDITPYIK